MLRDVAAGLQTRRACQSFPLWFITAIMTWEALMEDASGKFSDRYFPVDAVSGWDVNL